MGVGVLSPAIGNGCANHAGSTATGTATAEPGTGNGQLLGMPVSGPLNQCGGADPLPSSLIVEKQCETNELAFTTIDMAKSMLLPLNSKACFE